MAGRSTSQAPELAAPVTLQIMSDLHLETPRFLPMYTDFRIEPRSPYLALLGDIGHAHDRRLFQFLEGQLEQFDIVFFVMGNHEPYEYDGASDEQQDFTYSAAVYILHDFERSVSDRRRVQLERNGVSSLGQFVLLDKKRFDLSPTVAVLGCTLFSRISDLQKSATSLFVSDFSMITGWSVDAHNASHQTGLEWLNNEVETICHTEPERRIVILTHYSPTNLPEANNPDHLEDNRGVQTAFVTALEQERCWTSPAAKVWAFGHTHFNCDFVDSQTGKRVVANQRGYGREDSFNFDPDKIIIVE